MASNSNDERNSLPNKQCATNFKNADPHAPPLRQAMFEACLL